MSKQLIVSNASKWNVSKDQVTKRCQYALPFWSFIISLIMVRMVVYCFGSISFFASSTTDYIGNEDSKHYNGGAGGSWIGWYFGLLSRTLFWSVKITGTCFGPSLGWMIMSILVVLRYTGPFCPIGK